MEGGDTLSRQFPGESLVANHPGGSAAEMATVYSLTNTLTANLPAIKKVKILIGGKERESLKGHIGLKQSLYDEPGTDRAGGAAEGGITGVIPR